jgi:hypothetical protein
MYRKAVHRSRFWLASKTQDRTAKHTLEEKDMNGIETLGLVAWFVTLVPLAAGAFLGAMKLTLAGAEDEAAE